VQQELKGSFMKKAKKSTSNDMRAEYKRSDFKTLERGKFYKKVLTGSNVVVLEPKIAKAFPSSAIVNQTLSDLLELARKSSRPKSRPRGKVARAG
jgi:hypothetical protein